MLAARKANRDFDCESAQNRQYLVPADLKAGFSMRQTLASILGLVVLLAQPCSGAGFDATGSLANARQAHTATLLPNGKVLVAGGFAPRSSDDGVNALASAELYDPATGIWKATGSLLVARYHHTATLLADGRVLVAGGSNGQYPGGNSLATAELYDPASGTWTAAVGLIVGRYNHTATLLSGGKVLVAGGSDADGIAGLPTAVELYDPTLGTWTATGSIGTARTLHTATLLQNGKVLVSGGLTTIALASAELYDPASGTWSITGSSGVARFAHAATLLPNGKVLVAGGTDNNSLFASAELYDPANENWMATHGFNFARDYHTETLLPNGMVLGAGGYGIGGAIASAELYNLVLGTWTATGNLLANRYQHTSTLLTDGRVLVAGGGSGEVALASAELYVGSAMPPMPPTLLNISTRLRVLTGDQVLIGGFIITGTDPKKVLIRGIGPSLTDVGVTLSDPILELHQGSATVTTNDNWKTRPDGTSQQANIEATTIPPTNDLESAIFATLAPGAYTAILAGNNRGTGIGLIEVYDLGQDANSELANISTRGFVDTVDSVMIGGLIIGPSGAGATAVLVRAIGPSLAGGGIPNPLADPTLELHDGNGVLIDSNDNWRSSQETEIEATGISPTDDREAAILTMLSPGAYTAIVRGAEGATGVGLVEVYHLD